MDNFRPVWAEVDLGALRRNLNRIKIYTDGQIMPIVKADAYGHGALEVVKVLQQEGIQRVGVAFLEEALEIRRFFPDMTIMVIGPTLPTYSELLVQQDIIPEVFQVEQAEALSRAAGKLQKKARLHIKIDTGMGRIGFRQNALQEVRRIAGLPHLEIEGIYTHLATADAEDLSYARSQLAAFDQIHRQLEAYGIRIPLRHAANSPAILQLQEGHYEICRPGIILYGLPPFLHSHQAASFEPVLSWKAQISHLKWLDPGESVGYGRSFLATRPTQVATLPLGYADGLRRSLSNRGTVLICGQRAPIIGKICMDQTMVDVTDVEGVHLGDLVTLLGKDQHEVITAEEMAQLCDTISYEILCGISKRVPRVYL